MPPTLRQVAAAGGVHHTTLSRALRGHPDVSVARAAELRALAEKMGYVPDPMLRALAAYRSGRRPVAFHSVIAWLNPSPNREDWKRHRTYRTYFAHAAERARQLGFHLEEISLPKSGAGAERVTSILNARNINGVIVVPAPVAHISLDQIDWKTLSAVRIGHSLVKPKLHAITVSHHNSMLVVMRELRARGYVRPGLCISRSVDERVNRHWSAAFLREQVELPVKNRLAPYLFERYSHQEFCAWLDRHRPDAIIVVGDDLIPASLRRHGLRVPEDIGVVALVQPEEGDSMTGTVESNRSVGVAAVDFLVAMMNRQERGVPDYAQTLLIDSSWIDGGTLRPRQGDSGRL